MTLDDICIIGVIIVIAILALDVDKWG